MAVRLSTMKGREKEGEVTYDEDVIAFAFYPNAFTMDVAEKAAEAGEANDLNAVCAMLEPILSWWDVMDDQDVRLPPTAENMRQFPLKFLMDVMSAVGEGQRPPESKG